jgi:uncharacterized membrane protein
MRIHQGLVIVSCLMFGLGITSCKHDLPVEPKTDDTNDPPTGEPCAQGIVYFEQDILPILTTSCAKPGCHNAVDAQDGVILNNYQNVLSTGDINPSDPFNSDFWEVITESDPDKQMPPPGELQLTPEQFNLIQLWLSQGAQNLTCDNNQGPCDSVMVSYINHVRPIINNKCLGCHQSATATNKFVNLSDYTGVSDVAANGRLSGSVTGTGGYTPMPFNGPSLNNCEKAKIVNWVNEGYSNN